MTYEEWQIEFSKFTGVPYHYLREIGDHWYSLIADGELLKAIKSN